MATASITAGPGSPRESGVWQYFNYLPEENKSVCLINKSGGAQCASVLNMTITNTITKLNFTLIL